MAATEPMIIVKAGLDRAVRSASVTVTQARKLLLTTRAHADPVPPARLGAVGDIFHLRGAHVAYACAYGTAKFGADETKAMIPFAVEAWATPTESDTSLLASINRTPVAGNIEAARDKKEINVFGCGLSDTVAKAPKDEDFDIWLNVISPYVPITSDGKEPDFVPFLGAIKDAVGKAVRKARRPKAEPDSTLLPKRRRGRQSSEAEAAHRQEVAKFCRLILQIHSTLDFAVGSRDYCYLLEEHGLGKGDFDAAQKQITDCRKSGDLPLDICAEDASRETIGVEQIDSKDVPDKAESLINRLRNHAHEQYMPISFWDYLDVYIEVATEKLSLRNLFEPVCREFHVPITNLKGWSDLNARAAMMRRFAYWAARGTKCVLLLCGDHDPGGLQITETMRKNLEDLSRAVGWSPENLVINRFGLNAPFIDRHGLTWIDNLETSSGGRLDDPDHADHGKQYVQQYIEQFGVRKCEANALVVVPDVGRQLCRDAILRHVPAAAVERYERKLDGLRQQLREALRERVS
jgi:hypothetical protein